MPDIRAKALGYLREGNVTVKVARTAPNEMAQGLPTAVVALVQGHHRIYAVDLDHGQWSCTCGPPGFDGQCAHAAAVQLVTGHPSPAAKEAS